MTQRHPTRGGQLLREWRAGVGVSRWEAAKLLDIRPENLKRYESGGLPSLRHAVTLERRTGGVVYCASWTEDPV